MIKEREESTGKLRLKFTTIHPNQLMDLIDDILSWQRRAYYKLGFYKTRDLGYVSGLSDTMADYWLDKLEAYMSGKAAACLYYALNRSAMYGDLVHVTRITLGSKVIVEIK